jgi:hypothetical protein
MKNMYAIKAPSGLLLIDTTASNKSKAWDNAYSRHLYYIKIYYASCEPQRLAYKNGYRCVKVNITEAIK